MKNTKIDTIFRKLNALCLMFLLSSTFSFSQIIYQHNFGTTTGAQANPYTVAPPVIDANLNTSQWQAVGATYSFTAGSTGAALAFPAPSTSALNINLTFNVAAGYACDITSCSFWRVRSATGYQNYALSINGTNVTAGTVPTSAANTGSLTCTGFTGLTGTVTVTLTVSTASAGGTIRIDDFTLNGSVYVPCTLPTITLQPANTGTCAGGNVQFATFCTDPTPTYQWQVSTNGGISYSNLGNIAPYSNVTNSTMDITAATVGLNNYRYRCVVTAGGCSSTSNAAILSVGTTPTITSQPANSASTAGSNVFFYVNSPNAATYQWQESINGGSSWTNLTNVPPYTGVTSHTLFINGVTAAMNNFQYRCVLNGCAATVYSNAAILTIVAATGTVFLPGDLVLIGYDSKFGTGVGCGTNTATDIYYLTNFVDVTPGTQFKIINSRFEAGAPANTRTNRWFGPGDSAYMDPAYINFTWNGPGNIAKGTIWAINTLGGTPFNIRLNGTSFLSNFSTTANSLCNISSNDPDQIFVGQGTFTAFGTATVDRYNLFAGKVLFGLTNKAAWVPITSPVSAGNGGANRVSRLPDDIECFNLESATNREVYYYMNSATHTGSQRSLLGAIMNTANWGTPASTACLDVTEDWTGFTASATGKVFSLVAGNPAGFWVGDLNNDWFNCRNWEGLIVPDPSIDVTIPTTAYNNCHIDISAYPTTAAKFYNLAQCKNLTISGWKVQLAGDNNDRLQVNGNLSINLTGQLDMDDGNNGTNDGQIYLLGNWTNTTGMTNFQCGNGAVHFLGNTLQTMAATVSGVEVFGRVILDNPLGNMAINGSLHIGGDFNFVNGIVNPVSLATDVVGFFDDATSTFNNINSYVAGRVHKRGNDAFIFPIGKSARCARAAISAPSAINAEFSAEYFKTGYGTYTMISPLINVSNLEYWIIDRENGTDTPKVTLYWEDTYSSVFTPTANLVVARHNGTDWESEGQTAFTGNVTKGTLTSTFVSNFSPFTLGLIDPTPLPVTWLTFTATKEQEHVLLKWSAIENDMTQSYQLQRSNNGINYQSIDYKIATGGLVISNYQYEDQHPFNGRNYYKIMQTDIDGRVSFSNVVTLDFNHQEVPSAFNTDNEIIISGLNSKQTYTITVIDALGKIITVQQSNESNFRINTTTFASGIYNVTINDGNTIHVFKSVIR
ncbi:MAG: T9SS type A sorting domain-containing protein [Bacteroidetes bacterium]|nr:T9SS type A sorting domain-containing protein [Bacteroidota bacterium]